MANLITWNCDSIPPTDYSTKVGATLDTSNQIEGTGCMKMTFGGTQADHGVKKTSGYIFDIAFGTSYYNRFWMKMDSSFAWSGKNKSKMVRWTSNPNGWSGLLTCYMAANGFSPQEHSSGFNSDQGAGVADDGPTVSYDLDPSTNSAVQNWQEYIILIQTQSEADATDGLFTVYVNGSSVGGLTGVIYFSGGLNQFGGNAAWTWGSYGMFFFPQDVASGKILWIDDVSLDTTWNSNFSAAAATRGSPLIMG